MEEKAKANVVNDQWFDNLLFQKMHDEEAITINSGVTGGSTVTITGVSDNSLYDNMAAGQSYGYSGNDVLSGVVNIGSVDSFDNQMVYITDNTDSINYNSVFQNVDAGKNVIQTSKGARINIDELAEFMDVVKKRLLVLTPNFEMHEKYPMLKQLYDEYKAMERLLSGPDSLNGDNND